jgi:O-antigen/teichoic acid export membrane protein
MPPQVAPDEFTQTPASSPSFVTNVIWSWAGTAINIFIGVFLSRIIVRGLGEERYGVWALVWSMFEYLWFFDLGFNTAVANFLARYRARNESGSINTVINTALFYFTGVSAILITLAILISRNVEWLFPRILPQSRQDLSMLILITGISSGLFVLFQIFSSALDGFQRFDLTTRSWVTTLIVRSGGGVLLLKLGYGLRELAIVFVLGQFIGYLMNFFSFRRVFPELRLSFGLVRVSMIKEMARYGIPSFMANTSNLALNQTGFFIARYTSMADVGFYTVPMRMLQYAVDAVSRVGMVTRSNAAEREASGRKQSVWNLGVFSNRYCFTLFAPLSIFLLIYGRELIKIWMTPVYAERSAPLLPILVPAIAFVMAGQFNSSSILFGLGAHQRYAYGLMVEAGLNVTGMLIVIPHYGIFGAACVSSALMLLIRGVYTPLLVCKSLDASLTEYMREIYLRPVLTAIPVAAAGVLLKRYVTGQGWAELILAGSLIAGIYLGLALFTCVDTGHRRMLFGWIENRWAARKAT